MDVSSAQNSDSDKTIRGEDSRESEMLVEEYLKTRLESWSEDSSVRSYCDRLERAGPYLNIERTKNIAWDFANETHRDAAAEFYISLTGREGQVDISDWLQRHDAQYRPGRESWFTHKFQEKAKEMQTDFDTLHSVRAQIDALQEEISSGTGSLKRQEPQRTESEKGRLLLSQIRECMEQKHRRAKELEHSRRTEHENSQSDLHEEPDLQDMDSTRQQQYPDKDRPFKNAARVVLIIVLCLGQWTYVCGVATLTLVAIYTCCRSCSRSWILRLLVWLSCLCLTELLPKVLTRYAPPSLDGTVSYFRSTFRPWGFAFGILAGLQVGAGQGEDVRSLFAEKDWTGMLRRGWCYAIATLGITLAFSVSALVLWPPGTSFLPAEVIVQHAELLHQVTFSLGEITDGYVNLSSLACQAADEVCKQTPGVDHPLLQSIWSEADKYGRCAPADHCASFNLSSATLSQGPLFDLIKAAWHAQDCIRLSQVGYAYLNEVLPLVVTTLQALGSTDHSLADSPTCQLLPLQAQPWRWSVSALRKTSSMRVSWNPLVRAFGWLTHDTLVSGLYFSGMANAFHTSDLQTGTQAIETYFQSAGRLITGANAAFHTLGSKSRWKGSRSYLGKFHSVSEQKLRNQLLDQVKHTFRVFSSAKRDNDSAAVLDPYYSTWTKVIPQFERDLATYELATLPIISTPWILTIWLGNDYLLSSEPCSWGTYVSAIKRLEEEDLPNLRFAAHPMGKVPEALNRQLRPSMIMPGVADGLFGRRD